MIRYECDRCAAPLSANAPDRFILKMEIYAAAGVVDLDADAATDAKEGLSAVLDQLRRADPDEIEDQTYRAFRFDLCDACRRAFIAKPLG